MNALGVTYALIALIGWGLGDFFVQRSVRKAGIMETLFAIRLVVVIGLLPFVWHELGSLTMGNLGSLFLLSLVGQAYAVALYAALKRGKISVVESVVGIELPLTVALSVIVGGERLGSVGSALFLLVTLGIVLAVTRSFDMRRFVGEKGVALALAASVLAAVMNFSLGFAAIHIGPLLALWLLHAFLLLGSAAYFAYEGGLSRFAQGVPRHAHLYAPAAVFDTMGSIGFVLAVPLISISLATTISESYLALAALLGVVVGGERLRRHQYAGSAIAIASVIAFAKFFPV